MSEKPFYCPLDKGIYEVAPDLKPLGFDYGNGEWDKKTFQRVLSTYDSFQKNKIECRTERLSKYFVTHELDAKTIVTAARFIAEKLKQNCGDSFSTNSGNDHYRNSLTGDCITWNESGEVIDFQTQKNYVTKPLHLLDCLALQFSEDMAILKQTPQDDYLAALHLSSPSHWAAEDKIGKNFIQVHSPIPANERLIKASRNIIQAMVHKGPFVRFVWSFVTDTRENHHPIAPPGVDQLKWKGRSFNKENVEPFYLRVERQVTHGLPEVNASLFTIGITFIPASDIKKNATWNQKLQSSLLSMTPESRVYKGLETCFDDVISWLKA